MHYSCTFLSRWTSAHTHAHIVYHSTVHQAPDQPSAQRLAADVLKSAVCVWLLHKCPCLQSTVGACEDDVKRQAELGCPIIWKTRDWWVTRYCDV